MLEKIISKIGKNPKIAKEASMEAVVPNFIPYACHYDPNTILTKNGELLQVIKITGFYNEKIGANKLDLRETLRKSIAENIKSDKYAIWMHTIRKKQNLNPGGNFKDGFANSLNKEWINRNSWESQYINEIYITILRDGASLKLSKDILNSLFFPKFKKNHEKFLKESNKELRQVTDQMLGDLSKFGAHKLGLVNIKGKIYSNLLGFLSKIINFSEAPFPLPTNDLSQALAEQRIAFGFDTLEIWGKHGRTFGTIFTVKETPKLPATYLDKFLQLPQEFIITQTINFIDSKIAEKDFKEQHYLFKVSGALEFSEEIGIESIMNDRTGSPTDFGNSQIIVLLLNSDLKKLDDNIRDATMALRSLGIVATRRDLRMEECFWSQMPGNFNYLSRQKAISTKQVGEFVSLYTFASGNKNENLWGPAVTAFHTLKKTPYFFNFHKGDNGHTTLIGPHNSGKTALMNFLISESRKFNGNLFFFDQLRASKVFIKSLGGNYAIIKPLEKNVQYSFNPFHIEDKPENRNFLKSWIICLANATGIESSRDECARLEALVDYIFTLPAQNRRLGVLAGHFGGDGKFGLESRMSHWHSGGSYSHLFDNEGGDITSFQDQIYAFGVSYLIEDQVSIGPVILYLLHQIEASLDGIPTMVVFDDAWKLINNPIFVDKIADWMDRLRQKNAMVILSSENITQVSLSEFTNNIKNKISTNIFFPNPKAASAEAVYKDFWGLSNDEFATLSKMSSDKRQFMLRQGDVSIVAALDLTGMKELDVLSGSDKTVKIMEDAIAMSGEKPEDWLPFFYKKIKDERSSVVNLRKDFVI